MHASDQQLPQLPLKRAPQAAPHQTPLVVLLLLLLLLLLPVLILVPVRFPLPPLPPLCRLPRRLLGPLPFSPHLALPPP